MFVQNKGLSQIYDENRGESIVFTTLSDIFALVCYHLDYMRHKLPDINFAQISHKKIRKFLICEGIFAKIFYEKKNIENSTDCCRIYWMHEY